MRFLSFFVIFSFCAAHGWFLYLQDIPFVAVMIVSVVLCLFGFSVLNYLDHRHFHPFSRRSPPSR